MKISDAWDFQINYSHVCVKLSSNFFFVRRDGLDDRMVFHRAEEFDLTIVVVYFWKSCGTSYTCLEFKPLS